MTPFVVFALARSRTKWLSNFLSYSPWHCGHDEARHLRSLDDIRSWFAQSCTGTVETAASPFWRLLGPDVRAVTVRRPVDEVLASLHSAGLPFDEAVMRREMVHHDRKLDQIERRLGARRFECSDLAREEACAALFEHCTGMVHDSAWWEAHSRLRVSGNLQAMLRYAIAHLPQLEKVAKQAKHRILANMQRAPELDGVTFQHEPFRQFYDEAQPLIAEHCVQADFAPDEHALKNLPLLERLDELGAVQTATARSNGRLFGYLITIIGPSFDARDQLVALHTSFYTSPLIRGLGPKLQRAANEMLKTRGIAEVQMRAGVRGAGPRLGTFYRRLGAEHFGTLYRLELH